MPFLSNIRNICILLVCLLSFEASAQKNPFKINDEVYDIYLKGLKSLRKSDCLVYADSMYSKAEGYGDKKGMCIAKVLHMRHYALTNDWGRLNNAAKKVREISREYGFLQYYYYSYHTEATWLLNHNMALKAWHLTQDMKKEAYAEKNNYGIYYSLRGLGQIYFSRQALLPAIKNFEAALKHVEENLPDQSPAGIYNVLAIIYLNSTTLDYGKALDMVENAIAKARDKATLRDALDKKAYILYKMNDTEKGKAALREARKLHKTVGPSMDYYKTMSMIALRSGNIAEAMLYCDSIPLHYERLLRRQTIYETIGQYDKALKILKEIKSYNDSTVLNIHFSDIAEFEAQLKLDNLRNRNIKLDLENSRLVAQQLEQQLALEHTEANNRRLEAEVHKAEVKRLNEETKRIHAEATMHKVNTEKKLLQQKREMEQLKLQETENKLKNQSLLAWSSLMCIITAFLVYIFIKNKRQIKILNEKNKELDIARKKAEQTDKLKTFFINNMSHEIRTPLNVIVGYSQILSDPEIPFEEEEKKEMGQQVLEQSEMLTTLINDILNIAELDAGTYKMKFAPTECNTLCESAISMVRHRCPAGVNMYWTSDINDGDTVITDAVRVKQILVNFLTNATKFTEKGEIHLHCTRGETLGSITMSVSDTGKGIPPEHAEDIFERFKKLDQFKQGNGIGLNLCRLIAKQMNGEVKLDTSYTNGARFIFSFPEKQE